MQIQLRTAQSCVRFSSSITVRDYGIFSSLTYTVSFDESLYLYSKYLLVTSLLHA